MSSTFETDQALAQWVEAHGLRHVERLGADVLLPHLGPAERQRLGQVLHRHRLTDFATTQSLRRFGYALAFAPQMRDQLPGAALSFLEAEREAVGRARAELPRRLRPPDDASVLPLFRALQGLRDTLPSTLPPRLERALSPTMLELKPSLPGFVFSHDRRWVPEPRAGYGLIHPVVQLKVTPRAASAQCTCAGERCLHALEAIDCALLWLRQPLTEAQRRGLEELTRAPWERALQALNRALEASARARASTQLTWRLQILEGYGVEVHPFVHRVGSRGVSPGSRVSPARLLEQHRGSLSPEDLRLAEACLEGRAPVASQRVLLALVDHPRLFLDEAPDKAVRVERCKVGLVAEDRHGAVVLAAGIDGAPLSPRLRESLVRRPTDPHHLWDAGARRLGVLDVGDEVIACLQVLAEHGDEFPPESYGALVEQLAQASSRLPVAMPRSVMGEAVAPRAETVLQLGLCDDRSVRLELRARPIAEGRSFPPGEGPRDAYARRGTQAVHAVRDFAHELSQARALLRQLPLDGADARTEFEHLFPTPAGALRVLAAHRELDPKPPLEWLGGPLRLLGSAAPTALKVTLEKRRDWFGALGGLAVEGERVELAVLLDAARRKERFVQVRADAYVEIEEALQRQLARLSDHTYASKHGVEFGPSAAEALDALVAAGANLTADEAWRSLAEKIFAAKERTPRVPASLKATLRDYQEEGFRWLARLASWGAGAVLADDMGLGKTVQALTLLLDRARLGPALVLAPTSVGFIWLEEAARFAPSLRLQLYAESPDRGAALARLGPRDVLVLSYGLLARDIERLREVRFSTLVLDEAQALKNAGTQRARAARELQGDFKVALSGTPMENHLGELWSLFRIVFPGLLGSWEAFRARFANPIEKKIDPTAAPALGRVLQPFLLRRTKAQVEKELPARTEVRVPVVLSPEEWQLYEDARLATLSELETRASALKEQERRIQILASLTRLRLLASHPRLYDPASKVESSKLQRLLELLDELGAEGHRALVFSQFTSHLALVREVLDARGLRYVYLDGSTPAAERKRRVAAFQGGDAPLFLISLKAGGFGLNLTGADNVIHLDPWWNPAVEDQASDRAHRIGQTRPVTVYRLISRGTIEEQILSLHLDKRALVNALLEGKEEAGRLSTSELLALLTGASAPVAASATRH